MKDEADPTALPKLMQELLDSNRAIMAELKAIRALLEPAERPSSSASGWRPPAREGSSSAWSPEQVTEAQALSGDELKALRKKRGEKGEP